MSVYGKGPLISPTVLSLSFSVLIICMSIKNVNLVYDHLEKVKDEKKTKDHEWIKTMSKYARNDISQQRKLVDQKLSAGYVMVASNLAGRGMDLKMVDDNVVLHVIVTFLPDNDSIERQVCHNFSWIFGTNFLDDFLFLIFNKNFYQLFSRIIGNF